MEKGQLVYIFTMRSEKYLNDLNKQLQAQSGSQIAYRK